MTQNHYCYQTSKRNDQTNSESCINHDKNITGEILSFKYASIINNLAQANELIRQGMLGDKNESTK